MSAQPQLCTSERQRFFKAAQDEMSAFERREAEFRKQDRKERADRLHISFNADLER